MRESRNSTSRGPRTRRSVVVASGGVPVNTGAPTISFAGSDNSVGVLCTCSEGSWSNAPTSFSYNWLRQGVSIGAPDQPTYTPVSADAGSVGVASQISCEVTPTNGSGSGTPAASNAITIKPYRTAAPVLSFAGSDNSVGVLATCTIGTVLGATTNAFDWLREGVSIGAADQDTYTTVSADAGTVGVPSACSCEVTSSNAGGSIAASESNAITIKPYWTANPVISGDPWPSEDVTATAGTVLGATSEAAEWKVGGVGTGDTDATYAPLPADVAGSLRYDRTGTNAGGSTIAQSNAITVQRVMGMTRPTNGADRPVTATKTMPADVSVVLWWAGSGAASDAGLVGFGDVADQIAIVRNGGGAAVFGQVYVAGVATSTSSLGVGGLVTGTPYVMMASYDGSTLTCRVRAVGGATTTVTVAVATTLVDGPLTLWSRGTGATSRGVAEAKVLSRLVSLSEFDAWDDPSVVDADVDIIAELYPAPATAVEGDTITTAAEIIGADSIIAASARLTDGGWNVAI